jgi:adenylate cyclase
MATEIEHKYLVKSERWKKITPDKSVQIKQAYLLTDPDKTVRIRTAGEKGFVTIKGRTKGASRLEYEYEIPLADANELLDKFCTDIISKMRHYVEYENKTWEVDVFEGLNAGLIIAEIELNAEDEKYKTPDWVTEDVTSERKYSNSNLIKRPFSTW